MTKWHRELSRVMERIGRKRMAEILGYSGPAISMIVHARRTPKPEAMALAQAVFGIPCTDYLRPA